MVEEGALAPELIDVVHDRVLVRGRKHGQVVVHVERDHGSRV
jgi:hypothetical protein